MTLTKVTLGFATLALGIASAASYSLVLTDPAWVGNTQLKPGEYKVEMQGGEAIFRSAPQTIEAPAAEEKADKKFPYTSFESVDSKIREIHLGGHQYHHQADERSGTGPDGCWKRIVI